MVTKLPFGVGMDGTAAGLYKISAADGAYVSVTDYGATVVEIAVPDKAGNLVNVSMAMPDVAGYQRMRGYWGATIGRVGNRLGNSSFEIGGVTYKVAANDGPNHLHGGIKGFDKHIWNAEITGGDTVRFSRLSPDGEEGYPGNLTVSVAFTFDDEHRLTISYNAVTDADTLCNLTNHTYFNLNGAKGRETGSVFGHTLQINASHITACGADLLPTGEIVDVTGTPFDFRSPRTIGSQINEVNINPGMRARYDHNFCLDAEGFRLAAVTEGDETGIIMETWTDLPGLQLFTSTGNTFCLESQCYPNWNNNPHFPSIILKKGEEYKTKTMYSFKKI